MSQADGMLLELLKCVDHTSIRTHTYMLYNMLLNVLRMRNLLLACKLMSSVHFLAVSVCLVCRTRRVFMFGNYVMRRLFRREAFVGLLFSLRLLFWEAGCRLAERLLRDRTLTLPLHARFDWNKVSVLLMVCSQMNECKDLRHHYETNIKKI